MKPPAWAVGIRKLGPGVYVQGDAIHIYAPEICETLGKPLTPENLRAAEEGAIDAIRDAYGFIPAEIITDKDGPCS